MKRPWIHIAGATAPADAREAVLAGADLIGLHFHADEPRALDVDRAAGIVERIRRTPLPAGRRRPVRTVAIFVEPEADLVQAVLRRVGPDVLEFLGEVSPSFCQSFRTPFIKGFELRTPGAVDRIGDYLGGYAVGHRIDPRSEVSRGAVGARLGYDLAERALRHPKGFLLSELRPPDVTRAVQRLRPFGVEVCAAVEQRMGQKSAELMASFVRSVEAACRG